MNEGTIKDRLMLFINYLGMPISRFELEVGFTNGSIRNLKHSPNERRLSLISRRYPQLNKEWLLTGNGEMLNSSNSITVENSTTGNNMINNGVQNLGKIEHVESFLKIIENQSKQIDQLISMLEKKMSEDKENQ